METAAYIFFAALWVWFLWSLLPFGDGEVPQEVSDWVDIAPDAEIEAEIEAFFEAEEGKALLAEVEMTLDEKEQMKEFFVWFGSHAGFDENETVIAFRNQNVPDFPWVPYNQEHLGILFENAFKAFEKEYDPITFPAKHLEAVEKEQNNGN